MKVRKEKQNKNTMRELLASALEFFHPIAGVPAIEAKLQFVDENFFALGAGVALLASFLMWANI